MFITRLCPPGTFPDVMLSIKKVGTRMTDNGIAVKTDAWKVSVFKKIDAKYEHGPWGDRLPSIPSRDNHWKERTGRLEAIASLSYQKYKSGGTFESDIEELSIFIFSFRQTIESP